MVCRGVAHVGDDHVHAERFRQLAEGRFTPSGESDPEPVGSNRREPASGSLSREARRPEEHQVEAPIVGVAHSSWASVALMAKAPVA